MQTNKLECSPDKSFQPSLLNASIGRSGANEEITNFTLDKVKILVLHKHSGWIECSTCNKVKGFNTFGSGTNKF